MKRNVFLTLCVYLFSLLLNCNLTGSSKDSLSEPVLSSPENAATEVSRTPTLTWTTVSSAETYRVQVSTATTFTTTVVDDSSLSVNSKTLNTLLANNTTYYWRANAKNTSGKSAWSTVWSFTTCSPSTVTDADGNVYTTITIGAQTWTVENLRTTKFNDGTSIPFVSVSSAWSALSTPGYCYHGNTTNASFIKKYGALYNWYTVITGKLAPQGWHVPSKADWDTLWAYLIAHDYMSNNSPSIEWVGKSLAATTDWISSTGECEIGNDLRQNNKSGFTALPAGERGTNGSYGDYTVGTYWWATTEYNSTEGIDSYLLYNSAGIDNNSYEHKRCGCSVRLVKD